MKIGRRQSGVFLDLGQVLVFEAQPVPFEGRRLAGFMGFDHRAPAPAVAADSRDRHRIIGRQHPGIEQLGPQQVRWRRWG